MRDEIGLLMVVLEVKTLAYGREVGEIGIDVSEETDWIGVFVVLRRTKSAKQVDV